MQGEPVLLECQTNARWDGMEWKVGDAECLPLGAAQAACTESCSQPCPFGAMAGQQFSPGATLRALALLESREEGSSWQQSLLLAE